jgi:hypothetical protein
MPGDEFRSFFIPARVPHVCPGVSAVQHDFAGHRI